MYKSKLSFVLACGLAISLVGFVGCATKKKTVETAPVVKAPVRTAPAPAPAPRIQEPPQRESEDLTPPSDLKFNTIYFDFDKSDIKSDQRNAFNNTARLLERYKTVKILIEGHCDQRGTDEYNLALGQRRADTAKNYLVNYGISSSRITTVSYGEGRTADSGNNEAAWAKNRRCEFVITAR